MEVLAQMEDEVKRDLEDHLEHLAHQELQELQGQLANLDLQDPKENEEKGYLNFIMKTNVICGNLC